MVYINNNVNRRTDYGEFEFEDEIVAVGHDWRHTLYFTGTRFSPNSGGNNGDYPRYSKAQSQGKFRDRKFEPDTYNNGVFLNAWDNQNTSKDWFQVLDLSLIHI